eukprot:TRINITY_DN105748_c0_g1_i1.p2 TRINITY_DN105748_c0_g1~~TRINITY_DN105748_c0_g1_i1.p2  ORF type:complete len:150 (+),score=8.51 TRINITY_DN105748_c0_g1_i1:286-735(+)
MDEPQWVVAKFVMLSAHNHHPMYVVSLDSQSHSRLMEFSEVVVEELMVSVVISMPSAFNADPQHLQLQVLDGFQYLFDLFRDIAVDAWDYVSRNVDISPTVLEVLNVFCEIGLYFANALINTQTDVGVSIKCALDIVNFFPHIYEWGHF